MRIGIISISLILLFVACGKKQEAEKPETSTELPTLTEEVIDQFIRDYPAFKRLSMEMKQKFGDLSDDSPVTAARSTQAAEELEKRLTELNIDSDRFFGVFQKIIIAAMYINAVEQAKLSDPKEIEARIIQYKNLIENPDLSDEEKAELQTQLDQLENYKAQSEQRRNKIEELKTSLENPELTEEEKTRTQELIDQLELIYNPQVELPEGISEEEVSVVRSKFPELMAIMQPEEPQQATETPSETTAVQ